MKEIITLSKAELSQQATPAITADLGEKFIEYLDVKPKSIDTYRRALKQFFLYMADNGIQQPTRKDILNFKESLAESKKASTVQLYLVSVKQFFKWAEQEGLYKNIADHVKGVKQARGFKKDYLSSNAVKTILSDIDRNTLQGKRDYAIIALMITTGLRTIEVARADVADIRTCGDDTVLYIQGKGHDDKDEYVKLDAHVEAAIREYFKARRKVTEDQPLFTSASNNSAGQRMTTRSISRIAKNHMIEAGYNSDRFTAHSLRHTAATLNLLNGATPEETQQLLRHTNINTTMIYAHNLDRAKNNSESRIAAAIF